MISTEEFDKSVEHLQRDDSVIPVGSYCYKITSALPPEVEGGLPRLLVYRCPYWAAFPVGDGTDAVYGYCALNQAGDWQKEIGGLLFDQVKNCGVKEYRCPIIEE